MATAIEDPTARDFPGFLLARGKISAAALERAVRLARDSAERLGTVLLQLGLLSENDLAEAYCAYTNTPRMAAGT